MAILKFLILAIIAANAIWLMLQLVRVAKAIVAAQRNLVAVKRSNQHQTEIAIFVKAQVKLIKFDIGMGAMFALQLVMAAILSVLVTHLMP